MSTNRQAIMCRYAYDALDRLFHFSPGAEANKQLFFIQDRLTTEIQGNTHASVFQCDDRLLAHKVLTRDASTALLTTDQQRTVSSAVDTTQHRPICYTPYGYQHGIESPHRVPAFNGETPDPITGHYLLGNGYRAFNPTTMRFNSPDNASPFAAGGLNAYAYCLGDPVNRSDPTGHFPTEIIKMLSKTINNTDALRIPVLHDLVSISAAATSALSAFKAINSETLVEGSKWAILSGASGFASVHFSRNGTKTLIDQITSMAARASLAATAATGKLVGAHAIRVLRNSKTFGPLRNSISTVLYGRSASRAASAPPLTPPRFTNKVDSKYKSLIKQIQGAKKAIRGR